MSTIRAAHRPGSTANFTPSFHAWTCSRGLATKTNLREGNHHWRSALVSLLRCDRAVKRNRRAYGDYIITREQRLDLTEGRDPCVDCPIPKSFRCEYHKYHVPGNVEVAARGSLSHQVIVAFDQRALLATIEVYTGLSVGREGGISGKVKRKHIYVIAVRRLAVKIRGRD